MSEIVGDNSLLGRETCNAKNYQGFLRMRQNQLIESFKMSPINLAELTLWHHIQTWSRGWPIKGISGVSSNISSLITTLSMPPKNLENFFPLHVCLPRYELDGVSRWIRKKRRRYSKSAVLKTECLCAPSIAFLHGHKFPKGCIMSVAQRAANLVFIKLWDGPLILKQNKSQLNLNPT